MLLNKNPPKDFQIASCSFEHAALSYAPKYRKKPTTGTQNTQSKLYFSRISATMDNYNNRKQKQYQKIRRNESKKIVQKTDLNLILEKPESPLLLEPARLCHKMKSNNVNNTSNNFYLPNVDYSENNRRKQITPSEYNKIMRLTIGYVLAFFALIIVTFSIIYFV